GGTLIFVSHDRYFVERLATKIIEVGNSAAVVYPGTYKEFLWHKEHPELHDGRNAEVQDGRDRGHVSGERPFRARPSISRGAESDPRKRGSATPQIAPLEISRETKKKADADVR